MDINQQYSLVECLIQERQSIYFYSPNTAAIKPALSWFLFIKAQIKIFRKKVFYATMQYCIHWICVSLTSYVQNPVIL